MTMDRQTKEQMVERYSQSFASSRNAFVLGYRGVTVPEVTQLREKVREIGGTYEVVKNSLALLALQDSEVKSLMQHFDGPTAVAFSEGDIVGLAKVLRDFSKEVPAFEFRGGVVEGSPVDADEIRQIADLPSRDDLVARLLFMLQSPISRFVRGLGAIAPQFVRVLAQIAEKKDAQGGNS